MFLFSKRALLQRYYEIEDALCNIRQFITVAYPYKTNPLPRLIALLHEAVINIDHMEELTRVEALAKHRKDIAQIGLRIFPDFDQKNWDRFGFSLSDDSFSMALQFCRKSPWLTACGLHAHIGTNIRDIQRFKHLGITMAGVSPLHSETIGDFHDIFDMKEYAQAVLSPFRDCCPDTQFFVESGRTLVDYCGVLITQVLGIRNQTGKFATYVVDSGINILPTIRVYRHPICSLSKVLSPNSDQHLIQATLLGASCMGHDILARNIPLPKLAKGDFLMVRAVGAYNISRGVSFIHRKPGAVIWDEERGNLSVIRIPESFENYLHNEIL